MDSREVANALVRTDRVTNRTIQNEDLLPHSDGQVPDLIPGISAHRLDRLESEHIERLYGRLRKNGARSSTLLQVHRTLRAALNEAERRDRITKNPIRVVRSPQTEESEIEPLTVDDAQAILAVARERRNGVRWAVALALGLRQGEALGLKWSDIMSTWHHGCPESDQCGTQPESCPRRHAPGTLTVRRAITLTRCTTHGGNHAARARCG